MTFVKGNIKQGGRKKGTPNNKTKLMRDKFEDILNEFDTQSLINASLALNLNREFIQEELASYIINQHPTITFNKNSNID